MEVIVYEGEKRPSVEAAVRAALDEMYFLRIHWRQLRDGDHILVLDTQPKYGKTLNAEENWQLVTAACNAAVADMCK